MVDIISEQNEIIKIQSDLINKLSLLLTQYITLEELEAVTVSGLDKLTDIQKASLSYNSSILSLYKKEYEKMRKEVYKHEDDRNQFKIQKHTTETLNNK